MTKSGHIAVLCFAALSGILPGAAWALTQPNWGNMPAACLPGRAVPWDDSKSPDEQAPCSCPPSDMCPSTNVASLAVFLQNSPMPEMLTMRCCPLPRCPAGTNFAGIILPVDGQCNCPPGTNSTRIDDPKVPVSQRCVTPQDSDVIGGISGSGGEGAGGGDCLRGDSRVTLSNGQEITVAELAPGALLRGPDGEAKITSLNTLTQGKKLFYRINDFDFLITGEHPLKTTAGWKATNDTRRNPNLVVSRLEVGDVLVTEQGEVKVTSITPVVDDGSKPAINIRTQDDKPFYVDGVIIRPFKDLQFIY